MSGARYHRLLPRLDEQLDELPLKTVRVPELVNEHVVMQVHNFSRLRANSSCRFNNATAGQHPGKSSTMYQRFRGT